MGVLVNKGLEVRKEHIAAQCGTDADREPPYAKFIYFLQFFFSTPDSGKSTIYLFLEQLSFHSQRYPSGTADKKIRIQILLQPGD